MSTENSATSRQTYGRWERETNDTIVFISEQGRRIRFRYIGTCPSAAVYQCTQCPVTALMINADFRIVDPCAGHDCCLGACQPQSNAATDATSVSEQQSPANTPQASRSSSHAQNAMERSPPTDNATTAASAQQSSATTAPESRSPHAVRPSKKVIAKATYDANGYIQWLSQKYTGTTFTFHPRNFPTGRRRYFGCSACISKCETYRICLEACGITRRFLIVLDDNIVDVHPDDAGTNKGHLCQQPLLEEKLERAKALAKIGAQGTPNTTETGCSPAPETRKRFEGSSAEVKPSTKKTVEVVTIEDSDDDIDDDGPSRASKNRVKREHIDNTDVEQDRDPVAKFHRFIREFDFVDEYARYSVYNSGEPTAFIKRRHVMKKWIKFNQRN